MRVTMTVDLSGTRNGQPWPPRGTVIDLPDAEAQQYIAAGMAKPAGDEVEPATGDVETAAMPDNDVEKRSPVTTKSGPAKRSGK